MMRASFLSRIDQRDRALFTRWVIGAAAPRRATRIWTLLTHIGGLRASVAAILIPAALSDGRFGAAPWQAAVALVLSHGVVQLVKRLVVRARPGTGAPAPSHVLVPDEFSFPSGHSCAAMSVAVVYAMATPALAGPLLLLSSLVGFSRVRLGVHYPGDVLAGQVIAIATGAAVVGLW